MNPQTSDSFQQLSASNPHGQSSAGVELTPEQTRRVSGGEITITPAPKIPEYIPLSQSHPKVERDLPRVPYR